MDNSSFFIAVVALLLLSSITQSLGRTYFTSNTDYHALLALNNTITSDPNGILAKNWSSNISICYWIGVSCSTKHQRVIALNLSGFNLGGTIAPHLGNLTFLQSLNVSSNNFTGFIPPELSNLRRLKEINVGVNSFTGEIPSWFGALPELQHMILNNNTFSGIIPPSLFNISKLRTLDMGCNFLSGNIPQEIGNFSSLEIINLEYNQFTGSIPHGIFNLSSVIAINLRVNNLSDRLPSDICSNTPKLKKIYLSKNQLYGQIPPNIYKCRDLKDLRLSLNHLNGNIPSEIGSLSMLRILSLWSNEFKGHIPKQVGNLTSLKHLYLDGNKLTGALPRELGTLACLQDFKVYDNFLSGSIPSSMFNISNLKTIDLSNNLFSGSLPSTIGLSLFNLEELNLHDNRLSREIPKSIVNASKLGLLDMNNNLLSGFIPNFGNLRHLYWLDIRENNLIGAESPTQELEFLSSLTDCQYLKLLEISKNPLSGILPASIGNLSTSLHTFAAFGCNIKGLIPSEIGNLSSLLNLYLYENQLTSFIPTTIGKLKQLQRLGLDGNRLQGYIPHDLCQMTDLGELELSDNMLIGPIPECLGELKSLRNVYLGSNKLNSTIPSNFWNLRDLLALNLTSNNLSGQLSYEIGSLKAINLVDLSFNQFLGDIPSLIDGCQELEILSLSNNKFEGSIPQSLGNIRGLNTLDLSNNNLSGLIPNSLKDLQFLQHINVSYNRLEGEIPTRGPFVNFTAQSFVHNSALCGATIFQVPPCVEDLRRSRLKKVVLLTEYIVLPSISAIIVVIVILMFVRRRKLKKIPSSADISLCIAWRRVSYRELLWGTSSFSETNLLGKGSFSSVFKGTLSDGLNVAAKVFNLQLEGGTKSFDTESQILSTLRHRNLVRLIGCCCNIEFKALILAYMPNGSLERWLYSNNYCLNVVQRLQIAIDVALALEYLHHGHTFSVVHCDIKPSNVLLDEDMTAHVGDFGIAKLFDEGEAAIQTKTLATIGYIAPEYGSEGKVSTNGDVYSYGVMLLEMFTRKKPTDDMFSETMSLKDWVSKALQENAVTEVLAPGLIAGEDLHVTAKEQCISSIFDLAMKCLAVSPEERINMIEVVAALKKIKARVVAGTRRHQQHAIFITGDD